MRSRRWLALAWAVVVLGILAHQFQFWRASRLDTDVLALLPEDEQNPAVSAAGRQLADQAGRQLAMLVGADDWPAAKQAAAAARTALAGHTDLLQIQAGDAQAFDSTLAFYRPWRDRLLTPAQRDWLRQAGPEEVGGRALMQLYQPAGPKLGEWRDDPLGLWPQWWEARGQETRARPRDGQLWLRAEGRDWILLNYRSRSAGFAASGETPVTEALAQARAAAAAVVPGARLVAIGVPLYAEAAAAQASREMSTIGYGSLAAVLLLVWLTFRSLRPIALVALSLLIGCAAALSVTALLFERVHLITLVFGASLVGVAEDYGFHYFAARQGQPPEQRWRLMRALLPGLALALLTSVLAYLALGLAPFPGLRQMAVFSAVGLLAAFLTVVCWFPALDGGQLPRTVLADRLGRSLMRWPRWRPNRRGWLGLLGLACFIGLGLSQLRSQDDIRQLQSAPPQLIAAQRELGRLLGLPSPVQFYLIEGADAEQVLQRETTLKQRLDRLQAAGVLEGYRAVSDWLPAQSQQRTDAALTAAAEAIALQAVTRASGETASRADFAEPPLLPEQWLASPAAATLRAQWLGRQGDRYYSVLLLRGLDDNRVLPKLAAAAQGLGGVSWIDRTAQISSLMQRYRLMMGGLLVAGYAAVLLVLLWRFRRAAWRALLPTALGSLLTLALFGYLGEPLQLFNALALLLLLGMGVDYGIFLLEHPGDGSAWLAVALAGVSTLLSFGLLALSATPALRAFGLTMLLGEVLIWLLTPFFRPAHPAATLSRSHAP
ncbi:MMPL family transporter [Chitinimonas arctica]|uniref:MMPL family transporter n=1 Tax=Chitinimonas arctica TaxID=2594795 RepID=A0A516SMJ1_9NEIS|nr:MMPL family transporter [Chitinimonas arctica]